MWEVLVALSYRIGPALVFNPLERKREREGRERWTIKQVGRDRGGSTWYMSSCWLPCFITHAERIHTAFQCDTLPVDSLTCSAGSKRVPPPLSLASLGHIALRCGGLCKA